MLRDLPLIRCGGIGPLCFLAVLLVGLSDVTAQERFQIPANNLKSKPELKVESLDVEYYKPDGKGPFPAVVQMHGCSGLISDQAESWAKWFAKQGYATLVVDSFRTRWITTICDSGIPYFTMRIRDAFAALKWLAARPEIDGGRIGVMGFSNGGIITNLSMAFRMRRRWGKKHVFGDDPRQSFAWGIALYPRCQTKVHRLYNSLLVVIGSDDDWTPAEVCTGWLRDFPRLKSQVELHVIEGATHAYDVLTLDGKMRLGGSSELGYTMFPDYQATQKTKAIIREFLDRHKP